ncbi:hypothetical protein V5G24_23250 [Xanthobacter sp. VTT E-85241]|uniref:hypothetical protein n=1 Tax=Roseixanthobacter finlandensis TaxID=3119922 RepID=UPI00372AB4D7
MGATNGSYGILAAIALTLLAPAAFSLLSKSFVSFLTSAVLLSASVFIFIFAKTSFELILSSVIYVGALISASVIFIGYRIERAIRETRPTTPSPAERPALTREQALDDFIASRGSRPPQAEPHAPPPKSDAEWEDRVPSQTKKPWLSPGAT